MVEEGWKDGGLQEGREGDDGGVKWSGGVGWRSGKMEMMEGWWDGGISNHVMER